ncbi:MAG: NAD(P)H-hydrate epimerase, partial [Flavobacteriaceae bacterium]|nr:NAD(P)H-hydrate epimerase [Flavobacteriaceae bacterium]
MKILSVKQIYQADQATIQNKPISSIDLMENAAKLCFDWIENFVNNKSSVFHIFCGIGNNGGDGLVIARKLILANYKVKSYIVNFSEKRSNDFAINYKRLLQIEHKPIELSISSKFPKIESNSIVIDAIFGIGLTRSPQGFVKKIIQNINGLDTTIISIDFPSGLFSEKVVTDEESVIKANYTLTFQNPKLAFFLPDNQNYIDEWNVLDIGLDLEFINTLDTKFETICVKHIKAIYKPRNKFSHKGTFGHSLIIGGSFGKIGAVVLASKSALKIGSGLVSAYIPKCGYNILQTSNPEVMVEVDDENYLQYFNYKTK